jgi:cytochrome c-type biogenesis protein
MLDAPFGLALAAGMVAAVNPCGFALLPAYLSLLVAGETPGRGAALGRALVATAAMTAGFAAVFLVFGLAVAPVAGQVQGRLPLVTVAIGAVLVLLGVWLAAGRELPGLRLPRPGGRPVSRNPWSMVVFGSAYAIASLSCTIGPFLAIVVTSFRAGSVVSGVGLFVAYAVGMGVTVGVAALAVALAQGAVISRMRRAAPVVSRIGGVLLVLAGAYVAYYGWWETRVLAGAPAEDRVVTAALEVQRRVSEGLGSLGFGLLLTVFVALCAAAVLVVLAAQRARRAQVQPAQDD